MIATHARTQTRNVVHVQPCGDIIEHSDGFACVCGPRVEPVMVTTVAIATGASTTSHVGWLVTHEALDGWA